MARILAWRPGDTRPKMLDLLQNRVRRRRPDVWSWFLLVGRHELLDSCYQLLNAGITAPANGSFGNQPKPAFNLVQPCSIGVCEVDMKTRPLGQPGADLGVLVCGAVVDNQVQVKIWRN